MRLLAVFCRSLHGPQGDSPLRVPKGPFGKLSRRFLRDPLYSEACGNRLVGGAWNVLQAENHPVKPMIG